MSDDADPMDALLAAVCRGEAPPLPWVVRYGQDGVDPATGAWRVTTRWRDMCRILGFDLLAAVPSADTDPALLVARVRQLRTCVVRELAGECPALASTWAKPRRCAPCADAIRSAIPELPPLAEILAAGKERAPT